jgi:hypothetical protein
MIAKAQGGSHDEAILESQKQLVKWNLCRSRRRSDSCRAEGFDQTRVGTS